MKKIIISILVIIAVIILGLFAFRVFQKPSLPPPQQNNQPSQGQSPIGKCGDNVCDDFEKANPNACPADCEVKNNEQLNQCPQYTPPAPSFYDNCEKQNGKVESGNKDDNGCQLPPQCVLSETSSVDTTAIDGRAVFTVNAVETKQVFSNYLFGIQALGLDGANQYVQESGFKVFATHAPAWKENSTDGYDPKVLATMDRDLTQMTKVKDGQPWFYFYQIKKPSSLDDYYDSVRKIALHIKNAYPDLRPVFFFGNEPDWEVTQCAGSISSNFKSDFWNSSRQDFFATYEKFSKAVKSVNPTYIVGGVGLAQPVIPELADDAPAQAKQCKMDETFSGRRGEVSRWVTDFLNYSRDNNVSLDFLSFHAYSPIPYRVFYEYGEKLATVLKKYNSLSPLYGAPKLATNEWNSQLTDDVGIRNLCYHDGAWDSDCVGRLESYKTAWKSAHNILALINMVDQGLEFNTSQSALYQNVPEKTTEKTKLDIEGSCRYFTLICSNAVRNAYYAFKAFNSLLGARQLAVSGSDHMTIAAIAGRKPDGSITLIIAHYDPKKYIETYPQSGVASMLEEQDLADYTKKHPNSASYDGFRVDLQGLGWKDTDKINYSHYLVDGTRKLDKIEEKILQGGQNLTLSVDSSAPSVHLIKLYKK